MLTFRNSDALRFKERIHAGRRRRLNSQPFIPIEVNDGVEALLELMPRDARRSLLSKCREGERGSNARKSYQLDKLTDLILGAGRNPRPHYWADKKRIHLRDHSRAIKQKEIDAIAPKLGGFRSDWRVGLDGKLRRISGMRGHSDQIIGLL
eukprot:Plantae.Rhodophyta-Hildenbrandia_rubra.ctg10288.p1 GENE.Plantae.Rhodophyta-Hildenbrandia_rubra.ctg10288~~Plantae.Rhodophyta-Hildenbrandia_rubra.ctg10288.p1  ORF type:complete len:151 (+),score=17.51 Plantae.Rhodophyta-Hildenbrandia_rubra.ctg10288:1408-1860(+)